MLNLPKGVFLLLLAFSIASQLELDACSIVTNKKALVDEAPTLLMTVPNGRKLILGDKDGPERNFAYIAQVKGTPFEMGKAYGEMFQAEIKQNLAGFYSYYLDQLEELLVNNHVPSFVAKTLTGGVHNLAIGLLDLNVMITKKYTHKRYLEQIEGIAAGAKVHKREIERVNIVPEIIKAACTVAGLWGPATFSHQTLHVRALDWDPTIPISKFPTIIVYHPSTKGQNRHANFAWVGFVGSLTGMSPFLSIGEKVWYPPSGSVKQTRYGNPWTYVLRDVLYDAHNISTALGVLTNAKRTCAIHLGLGSAQDGSFRMLEYAEKTLNNYDDKNYTHYNESYHPKRVGLAFWDKGVQPNGNPCVGSILANNDFYGQWEMQSVWRILGRSHETGDTQLVVFDLTNQKVMISYSRSYKQNNKTVTENAYLRAPLLLNMNEFWKDF